MISDLLPRIGWNISMRERGVAELVCSIMELRCKEIVDIRSGACLGCVSDIEFDTCTASICALIVYGRPRFFGLLGREADTVIRWEQIRCIGEDTVLVENVCVPPPPGRRRSSFFEGALH